MMSCKRRTSGMASLPLDILVDILSRLPAKWVGKCKCISKYWRCVIDDPSFVERHHARAKSRKDGGYLLISRIPLASQEIQFFSANYEGGLCQRLFAHSGAKKSCYVQQSANGLICGGIISANGSVYGGIRAPGTIFILNPTTKEFVTLPPSCIITDDGTHFDSSPLLSFGFDPSTKEYKVLRMKRVRQGPCCNRDSLKEKRHYDYECEIFTLGKHSWRKIDVVPVHFRFGTGSCCVNGVIFWPDSWRSRKDSDGVIVAFDFRDERFSVIPLPSGLSCSCHEFRLQEVGGHLVLIPEDLNYHYEGDLWKLVDYQKWIWVKQSIMPPRDLVVNQCNSPCAVGEIQTGEILLHNLPVRHFDDLFSICYFDRIRKTFRRVEITGFSDRGIVSSTSRHCLRYAYCQFAQVANCVENLFSLRNI